MGQVQFGHCTFDATSRLLSCGGREVVLRGKVAELLMLLLERPNTVIGSEELRERLWPDGFVETGNLAQQVYLLRKALALDLTVSVDNVARSGYRLRASVPSAAPVATPRWRRQLRTLSAAAAAICVLVLSGGASLERTTAITRDESPDRAFALGRYFFDRRGPDNLNRALAYFRQVTLAAPQSAQGHAGIAEVWDIFADDQPMGSRRQLAFAERAIVEANVALARDPNSSTAHAALGLALLEHGFPPSQGIAELQRAIDLDPGNADAHEWLAIRLVYQGDLRDAARHFEAAAQVRPENVAITTWRAWVRYYLHDADDAISDLRTALAINPEWDMAEVGLASMLVERGRYRDAQQALGEMHSRTTSTRRALRALDAIVDLKLGRRDLADRQTRRLDLDPGATADDDAFLVAAFALEGHRHDALRVRALMHLDKHPEQRRMIAVDPFLGPVFRDLGGDV